MTSSVVAVVAPVPPLPKLHPRQRVRVVDVKRRHLLRIVGEVGYVAYRPTDSAPLRFRPDSNITRAYPIDTSRHPGGHDAVIVEPI